MGGGASTSRRISCGRRSSGSSISSSRWKCCPPAKASPRRRSIASAPTRAAPISAARSPPRANATAASASPASSSSPTAPTPARRLARVIHRPMPTCPCSPSASARPSVTKDREVLGVSVGDPALSDSNVELNATFVSHGFGDAPVEVRVTENGRPVHIRKLTPRDGVPYTERFRVAPRQDAASVYSVELQRRPGRADRRQQQVRRARPSAGTRAPAAARRGRARLRAQLREARVAARSRPRSGFGRAQGHERSRRGNLLRAGDEGPRQRARRRLSVVARRALQLRPDHPRERRRRACSRAISWRSRPTSSRSAAAAC